MVATERVALVGGGDLGRTVCRQIQDTPGREPIGFFDDALTAQTVLGLPVLGGLDGIEDAWRERMFDSVLITIGYNHLGFRADLALRLEDAGVPLATQVHPTCALASSAQVAPGSILFPGCVLDDGSQIHSNTILNAGCVIAHDSSIGPHTFLGPGVTVAGFVAVGAQCFLGVGTVLIDNIVLGVGTQTGAGAVVTRSFEGGALLVGIPAKPR